MRIDSRSSKTPKILIAVFAAVLLGGGAYAFVTLSIDSASPHTTEPESAPATLSDENAAAKKKFIEEQQSIDEASKTSGKQSNPSSDKKTRVDIKLSQNENEVIIRSEITGITDGTCELTVVQADSSYMDTAPIMFQPQFSTCAGFSVPKNELGRGLWMLPYVSRLIKTLMKHLKQ